MRWMRISMLGVLVLIGACHLGSRPASAPVVVAVQPGPDRYAASPAQDRIDQRGPALDGRYRAGSTGRGTTAYVFDGPMVGLAYDELRGRARVGYRAFPNDIVLTQRWPCIAHATAVASVIAGRTFGVAPGAEVVSVEMIRCSDGMGTLDAIEAAAAWVIADHAAHGRPPAIANWSWQIGEGYAPAMAQVVRRLHTAGIPVVVSAGNAPVSACRASPANIPGVIVVGASTHDGQQDVRADWSAWGECVTLYAPGDPVHAVAPDERGAPAVLAFRGTSFSAALVTGAMALHMEQCHCPRAPWSMHYARLLGQATWDIVRGAYPAAADYRGPLLYAGR